MRSARLILLFAAVLVPAGAGAQQTSAVRTIAVSGSAPNVCAVDAPLVAAGAQVNFRGLNGSALQIDRLIDPETLSTKAASIEIGLNAVCNYPHRLTVETQNNGLWQTSEQTASPPQGFARAVPYTATLTWALKDLRLDADAKVRQIADRSILIDQPAAGTIVLRLEIQPGATDTTANAPLLAGSYGDTLRVTVEPQQ